MSTPTSSNPPKKTKKCGTCKATVKIGDQGLLCEYCALWFHGNCEGVDKDKYDAISSSGEQTHWFCRQCNLKVMDTLRFIQSVKDDNEVIKVELATIKTQVKGIAMELNTKPSHQEVSEMIGDKFATIQKQENDSEQPQVATQQVMSTVVAEIEQRKIRENNIILYGVEERKSEIREVRSRFDAKVVEDILKICNVKVEEGTVTKVIRAGKFDKDKRMRPMIATLNDNSIKKELFRNSWKLRESEHAHKDVRISNDLTKTERENEKKLYEEAKKMQEPSGEYQFKVRGPPWARKIVKVPIEKPKQAAEAVVEAAAM